MHAHMHSIMYVCMNTQTRTHFFPDFTAETEVRRLSQSNRYLSTFWSLLSRDSVEDLVLDEGRKSSIAECSFNLMFGPSLRQQRAFKANLNK